VVGGACLVISGYVVLGDGVLESIGHRERWWGWESENVGGIALTGNGVALLFVQDERGRSPPHLCVFFGVSEKKSC
jgi:hypothetical protein